MLKKKMTLIAYVFSKLETAKIVVQKKVLKDPFKNTFLQSTCHRFQNTADMCSKALLPFTMSANDKYSLPNHDNLPQLIQVHLSKRELFSLNFFLHF